MNSQNQQTIGILHYSVPPVIGGVEAVIKAHLDQFIRAGYDSKVIAGRGEASALPAGSQMINIPEIDSNHPDIIEISRELETGNVPAGYQAKQAKLASILEPKLKEIDHLIIHNVFTKHFNLPLTGALHHLMDRGVIKHAIAWCHDFTWTSPSSRSKVHPGYPWDLLRAKRDDCDYVVVSKERQHTLAKLFECPLDEIRVVYNGVDPAKTLGLSQEGVALIEKLGLLKTDLNILMPVRVTQAKNIEFALKVLAVIKSKGIHPMLVVTGPPDPHDHKSMNYYRSLQDLRDELGLSDCMRFIFESGPDPYRPYFIGEEVVGELFRVSDVMFMPSHREGFGMPVMEAGLVGIPILSREVPAAQELAEQEAVIFNPDADEKQVAAALIQMLEKSPTGRLRRRVRREYNWQAIFIDAILPILQSGEKA
jgi:glycosyltransferase involved in cell wall biosynthesis